MDIVLQIVVLVGLILFVAWAVFYLWEGRQFHDKDRVVYMGSDLGEQSKIISGLIEKYVGAEKTSQYMLIEPGAGLSTVSSYLSRLFSWKGVEAVELRKSVYVMGRLRLILLGNKKVNYVLDDIFRYVPKVPAVQYCYLTTPILTKLCKTGKFKDCLVICLTFEIEGEKPVEIVALKSWQQAVRVYDFRQPDL